MVSGSSIRLGIGGAGLVLSSSTARAHEVGHTVLGPGDVTAPFLVVVGLPAVAGFVGGVLAVRHRRRGTPGPTGRRSPVAVGLLVVGLGVASLLSAVGAHVWVSAVGVTVGAGTAWRVGGGETASGAGRENHAELTFGAVSIHRLLEGVLVGTLFTAGAVVGVVGATVLAGHAALETVAVGGLYGTGDHRLHVVGAIALLQAVYVVGVVAGLGVLGSVPVAARTFVLAALGGLLVVVGTRETGRSGWLP